MPDQPVHPAHSVRESQKTHALPIITLLLLSPIIAEVLFGSTSLSTLYVLLPEIGTWGCGTLLIRSLVRRRKLGWIAILLLGIVLALAEECLIQQTSLAPLVGVNPAHVYGRALGVNWIYLLFQLGYESLWVVVVPIQLTELLFPSQRDDPWVGRRGQFIAGTVFVLAAFMAWYSWTQLARPAFHLPAYNPPLLAVGSALLTMVALVVVALVRPRSPRAPHTAERAAPPPWLTGGASFVFSLLWFVLLALAYNAAPSFPAVLAFIGGIAWAGAAWAVLLHWSTRRGWHDLHRLALVFGACVASMLAGFILHVVVLPIDVVGKLVFNVIALLWLSCLSFRLSRQKGNQSQTAS
ncbi:MAG TPA: hypothetical protein VKR42_00235 [Ktedonobacteraceae bacterium]|nr:hypothetical protein [Ktedonobacteraceae bacterium]